MLERRREKASGDRIGIAHELGSRALRDHMTAARAGARPEIEHVLGVADRVLVVLHDDQRVALGLELGQRVEQHAVVARMQADGRLVEDVAHAAQIRAELRGQPDALRFAAGQRRRRAVERQIRQTDLAQEAKPRAQLREQIARDLARPILQLQMLGRSARPVRPAAQ